MASPRGAPASNVVQNNVEAMMVAEVRIPQPSATPHDGSRSSRAGPHALPRVPRRAVTQPTRVNSEPLPSPTDPAGRFLASDPAHGGAPIFITDEGPPQAPTVICLHGMPGSLRDFRYFAPACVARGMRVIRVDLPGFGQTPRQAFPATSLQSRAAFVRGLMRAILDRAPGTPARFAVVAHSFGGGPALMAAALFPAEVSALVLFNSLGTRRHRGLTLPEGFFHLQAALLERPGLGERLVPHIRAFAYERLGLRSDRPLDAADLAFHARLIAAVDFQALRAAAAAVRCPTLVLNADDDKIVQSWVGTALADDLTGAACVTQIKTASGAHFLQKHQAPAAARWLQQVLVTAS